MAQAMCQLMKVVGYERYTAHGTDWGSRVVRDMGLLDPGHLVAVHTSLLRTPLPPGEDIAAITDDERDRLEDIERFNAELSGYMHIQGTRPQTLAYGLTDSPVGQLAWLVEKFKEWTDSIDVPEDAVDRDTILTNVMVYWLTGTAGSSSRIYYEQAHWVGNDRPDRRVNWNTPMPSTIPTAVAVAPRELFRSIRRFGERTDNVVRWTEFDRGGHFSALEVPDLLIEELRQFLRDFRLAPPDDDSLRSVGRG
jgi:microsomal epoxide hydrolase